MDICRNLDVYFYCIIIRTYAPVAQVDRVPASEAGCESSSLSRGTFMKIISQNF